jgi:hypothetical protein
MNKFTFYINTKIYAVTEILVKIPGPGKNDPGIIFITVQAVCPILLRSSQVFSRRPGEQVKCPETGRNRLIF